MEPVYYLSDFALFETDAEPLPFDDFYVDGNVCGFTWWGVEVNTSALSCEDGVNTFAITIFASSPANQDFTCEYAEVTPSKTLVAYLKFVDGNGENTAVLPFYKYEVLNTSCCTLPDDDNYWINIRSTGDSGCRFGWMQTSGANGLHSTLNSSFEQNLVEGDLAFCLSGTVPIEGEGEVLPEGEGEVLPEGEGEVLPEGEGEVLPEGEGEVLPEGEGEIFPEGEIAGDFDCPETGLLYGQAATPPSPAFDLTYYLSDETLWGPERPLPAEDFTTLGTVCDVHWWGVEVNSDGYDCERVDNTFVIQVGGTISGLLCENTNIIPTKTLVAENVSLWSQELNTDVLLSVYKYDVEALDVCCAIEAPEQPHYINIRSLNAPGDDCVFGWLTTLNGDNTTFAFQEDGDLVPWDPTNLAFCLTGTPPPVEGEGEVVVEGEGEVLPEGEGEIVVEGEGEVVVEGEGEVVVEGEGEVVVEGEGEVVVEGEGEVVIEGEGEVTPIVDCPADTVFAQPATSPEEDFSADYYLSNGGENKLWENLRVADSLYLAETITDVHWWGVEVDGQGLPCDAEVGTYTVTIADELYQPICEWKKLTPTRVPANFSITVDSVELPVYSYTLLIDPPCDSLSAGVPSLINIRKNPTTTGCLFGWLNTLYSAYPGDGFFFAYDDIAGEALKVDDSLAFCLTSIPPVEGEGEVVVEGEGEVVVEGEGEVVVEGEGEVVVEGEGEIVIEGELPPLVDCPPNTIFSQPATSPEEDYNIDFYMSNEGTDILPWENLAVAETLYLQDTIHDVHWWGVEYGYEWTKAGVTTFIIEIADATYTPICSWTVEPTKTPANFYASNGDMVLPVYAYDVVVDPPCVLDGSPAFINIRGANMQTPAKEGNYWFGWVTTMNGDGAFWVDDNYSVGDAYPVFDNLAFCLTSIPPVEGEGEVVEGEGEIVVEGEGEVVVEGEGEVQPEGEGEIQPEGEGEVQPEGEGEVVVEGETPAPALTLTKTADTESFDTVGDVITYTITVTNSGNVVITGIEVSDPLTGLDASIASLAPGQSQTFTEEYTVTQDDVDAGVVVNVASVTGKAPDGTELGDEDERDVPGVKPPCCDGCNICDPANLFLGALALLVLLLASIFLTGGDIIAPINFKF